MKCGRNSFQPWLSVQNNTKQHILPDSIQNINLDNYTAFSYGWQGFFLDS